MAHAVAVFYLKITTLKIYCWQIVVHTVVLLQAAGQGVSKPFLSLPVTAVICHLPMNNMDLELYFFVFSLLSINKAWSLKVTLFSVHVR